MLMMNYCFTTLQVESYALTILEKGTMVKEIVEVDVDNQTEVFRVPQHNDVDAMDMLNDFNVVRSEFDLYWERNRSKRQLSKFATAVNLQNLPLTTSSHCQSTQYHSFFRN